MKLLATIPFILSLFGTSPALAGGPGLLPEAPHGGIIQESDRMNMELVVQGSEIRLYPLSKMGQSVPADKVQVTASLQSPQKKRAILKLTPSGDHYIGRIEAKTASASVLRVEAAAKGEEVSFIFDIPSRN